MTTRVNLLPQRFIERNEHRRQLRKWTPIWGSCALALAIGQFGLHSRSSDAQEAYSEIAPLLTALDAAEASTQELREQASQLRTSIARVHALRQADLPLTLLQVVVDGQRPLSGQLRLTSYRMEDGPAVATSSPRAAPNHRLLLGGIAKNDVAVSSFVSRLKSAGEFSTVVLNSTQSVSSQAGADRAFQITCEATHAASSPEGKGP